MNKPHNNIGRRFPDDMTASLLLVFKQIRAYKMLEQRKFKLMLNTLRADHGEQAAPGATPQDRPSLQEWQPEKPKP